ncbi:MAG: hypothetical protein RIQ56_909 [Candidatus Parcubacteria bacterium]|jgi:hypothetical protein
MTEPIPSAGDKLQADVRVSIALKLRELLDAWKAAGPNREAIAADIWTDLMTADIPDDDPDAQKAYDSATRKMILNGALNQRKLKEIEDQILSERP